jgi:HlyD family secretion protein
MDARAQDPRDAPQRAAAAEAPARRSRGKLIAVALVAVALVAVAGGWAVCRAIGPTVDTISAARVELVQTIVASGRVASAGEINVGSMLGGVVHALRVREGDRVAAGQLLVEFDDDDLAAQVAQARAGVLVASSRVGQLRAVGARVAREGAQQAESNYRAALSTWTRQGALASSGAISAAELEAAQRSLDVARSQLQAAQISAAGAAPGGGDARVAIANRVQAESSLRLAEARLAQTHVLAPAAGVIARRNIEAGDVVSPGRTLLVLSRDGPTELWITPDERSLSDLRLGQRVTASAEAFASRPFRGTVNYIAPTIDALRGVVEVHVLVESPPDFLRPAMTVSVEVEVGRSPRALALDANAVRDAATSDPWVLVLGPSGFAARRSVRLGLRGARDIEITSGLSETDRVLAPSAAVSAGQRARAR